MRDLFVQTKTFVLFLAYIPIKNRLPVPLPLEPGLVDFNRARSRGSNPWQTQVMALGIPLREHFPLDLVA